MRNWRLGISTVILFSVTVLSFQNCSSGFEAINIDSVGNSIKNSTDAGSNSNASSSSGSPSSSSSSSSSSTTPTTPTATTSKIGTPQFVGITKDGKGLCNAVSFSQIPNNLDYFVGRVLNSSAKDGCDGTSWSLGLFKKNWTSNTLEFVKFILQPDVADSTGKVIQSTYDPHVAVFNNELWVAFECAGPFGMGASSCVAPFTIANGIDKSRLNVVVLGTYTTSRGEVHSASVPKLLVFKGEMYIYWTVCRFADQGANGGLLLLDITSRGAKITQESSGLKRLWVQNSAGTALPAWDRNNSSEVWGPTHNDITANGMADIFDFYVNGDTIYAVAAVGAFGCITPMSQLFGCYRTRIASSTTPLGHNIFNKNFVKSPALPANPMEYVRFFKNPSGGYFMMGQHTHASLNGTAAPASLISPGFQKYSIDLPNLKTVATGTSEGMEPKPTESASILSATFTVMRVFHHNCGYLIPTDIACTAATSRYCQSQGFLSGTGVLQHNIDNMTVGCVAKNSGTQLGVTLAQLKSVNSNCTQISTSTGACQSAVFHYCASKGYPGGGFGPQEANGDNLTVTCLKAANGKQIATTFSALAGIVSACNDSVSGGDSCKAAADVMCRNQGAVGGYGIVDYSGNAAVIGCFQ